MECIGILDRKNDEIDCVIRGSTQDSLFDAFKCAVKKPAMRGFIVKNHLFRHHGKHKFFQVEIAST